MIATPVPRAAPSFIRFPSSLLLPLAVLLGGLAPALTAAPALAQPSGAPDEALGRRHFERGQELYNKNRFLEAAREFEAGYQALPRSPFLLNIGHSYRRAQELRKAKAAYELMLKVDPTTQHRPLVEDLIRTIDDALVAQQETPVTPPPGGGSPATGTGTGPPLPGAPPANASAIDIGPPITVLPEEHSPTPAARPLWKSPWFWGVVGAVVVTSTVGAVLLVNRSPRSCPAQECVSLR